MARRPAGQVGLGREADPKDRLLGALAGNRRRRRAVQSRMSRAHDLENGEWMPRALALRRGAAVFSGPVVVLILMRVRFLPHEFFSGPLWLNAEILIEETVHTYHLTLTVAVSLFVHRLLVPERPPGAGLLRLPVLLWGFQSAVGAYRSFFGLSHWAPGFLLHLIWLVGVVAFLALGAILLLALAGALRAEPRRWRHGIELRSLALAGLVIATVFLDWVLVSTQASEARIVPALVRAAAIDDGG